MLEITDTFVCKKEKPYHRTGRAGSKQCQRWEEEDYEQMEQHIKNKKVNRYLQNAKKDWREWENEEIPPAR